MPLGEDNRELWQLIRPMLTDPLLQPSSADVAFASAVFREWLVIRAREPLLRLRTAEDVLARLSFHNTGPDQVPGVIVMQLRDDLTDLPNLAPGVDRLLVVFNSGPTRATVTVPAAAGRAWLLHDAQATGVDSDTLRGAYVATANGRVSVPPLSAVVFVAPNTEYLGALRLQRALAGRPQLSLQIFYHQEEGPVPPPLVRRVPWSQGDPLLPRRP